EESPFLYPAGFLTVFGMTRGGYSRPFAPFAFGETPTPHKKRANTEVRPYTAYRTLFADG
ncbi:hypothetical protein, partial [Tannerella forsythia]|uniref:hypothetical protein n=1 Tax=Tannerella forsythia TaxID=28112 RepID=UPI003C77A4CD